MKRAIGLVLACVALAVGWWVLRPAQVGRGERAGAADDVHPLRSPADLREPHAPLVEERRTTVAVDRSAATAASVTDDEDAEEESPPTPEVPGPGQALLRVHVVALETGEPLVGVNAGLFPAGDDEDDGHEWLNSSQPDPSRGLDNDYVTTDADGHGEFIVQADYAYLLGAWGDDGAAADSELALPPFAAGEERDVQLALATAWELNWHGRVIDGEHGGPIAGVEVCAYSSDSPEGGTLADLHELARGRTNGDGRVVLRLPRFESAVWLARDPGYFLAGGRVEEEASAPGVAQALVLHRPAALGVLVTDEQGRPAAGVDVRLSVGFWVTGADLYKMQGFEWTQRTDGSGRCEFSGLPPVSEPDVQLSRDGGVPQQQRGALELSAGRRSEVSWTFTGTTTVLATLRTPDGRPLAGRTIGLKLLPWWNADAAAETAGFVLTWNSLSPSEGMTRGTTDNDGRVRFDGVPSGWCLIGPQDERLPGTVTPVLVPAGAEAFATELVVDGGCEIRGRVLAPDGEPVRASVWYRGHERSIRHVNGDSDTDDDGSFVLGPLVAGEYDVHAGFDDDPFRRASDSAVATCDAGLLEIRLRRAGVARGVVVGPDGSPAVADDLFVDVVWGADGREDGRFEIGHLAPGLANLVALDDDGRIGVLPGVRIAEDTVTDGLVIQLVESALIVVFSTGERGPAMRIDLEWEGVRIGQDRVYGQENKTELLAPPGEVVVRWMELRDGAYVPVHEERRTVAAGETITLEHEFP